FLRRAQRDNKEIYLAGSSRIDPFFDAVAAQSLDVAKDIAALASADWLSKDEYEDDYCYARFLYLLVTGPADQRAGEMSDLLARFERALDGDESPRLQVCRALLARDSDAFGQAFADLLSQRAGELKERRPRAIANPVARLDCEVFVEGLAL